MSNMIDIEAILKEAQKLKEKGHISPTHILDVHLHSLILKAAKIEIDNLVSKGIIGKVQTINSAAYFMKNDRD